MKDDDRHGRSNLKTVAQVQAFLAGTESVALRLPKSEYYGFIERVLKRFGYDRLSRCDKGVILRYIERMTMLSRQQVTRLVQRHRMSGAVVRKRAPPQSGFARRFTAFFT